MAVQDPIGFMSQDQIICTATCRLAAPSTSQLQQHTPECQASGTMANPAAAIDPHMPAGLFRHAIVLPNRRREVRRLRVRLQLILNSAAFIISVAASFVFYTAAKPFVVDDPAFFSFVAFVLFLLGVWLALVAIVADRFPRAARVGEAIARTLRGLLHGR